MKKFYFILILSLAAMVLKAQTHFQPAFEGNGVDHMNIYVATLLEGAVELDLADFAAQRGLRQLRDSEHIIA